MELYFETELGKLYCGDAKDILPELEENSVDLIITDPPYLKEFLYTYGYLADLCPRLMKKGASLLTIFGHFSLEKVINYFQGKLKYRWLLCMNQFDGSHARMAMGIEVLWKPILWYVKESYPSGRGFLRDGVKIEGKSGQKKKLHKWEQDSDWCTYYVEKLSKPGDLVLDPYMGSGTTALVCEKLNRQWIGIEIDKEYCEIIKNRIQNNV